MGPAKTLSTIAFKAASIYIKAGLSVIPVRADGTKALALKAGQRSEYETRLATMEEITAWFGMSTRTPGVAILGGKVSGNLECIDFDVNAEENFAKFKEMINAENKSLMERLVVNRTPRPGYHVIYRCESPVEGSQKLASIPRLCPDAKREVRDTSIETRGEGGYFIAPGSPDSAHETKRVWQHASGRLLSQVEMITALDRAMLLSCARSLNKTFIERPQLPSSASPKLRPGDDYIARGPAWASIIEPHGWIKAFETSDGQYWRRPGKKDGVSATTGVCKGKETNSPLLYVFSTNAHPFEDERAYDKFSAYTLLNHNADFTAAAKALADMGYGEQRKPAAAPKAMPPVDPVVEIVNKIRAEIGKPNRRERAEILTSLKTVGQLVIEGLDLIEE